MHNIIFLFVSYQLNQFQISQIFLNLFFFIIVCHLNRASTCMCLCVCVLYILCFHFNICNDHYINLNYVFTYAFWEKPLVAIGCLQSSLTNKELDQWHFLGNFQNIEHRYRYLPLVSYLLLTLTSFYSLDI